MACTAVSIEPWPVMMAISVCGSSCFTRGRNSSPDMLGIIRSARTMSGETSSSCASASSAFSASTQSNPAEPPTVVQSLRTLGWSSTIRTRTLASSVMSHLGRAENPFHNVDELLHAKGLFNVRHAGVLQRLHGFLVLGVAGVEKHALLELRAVLDDPRMHVRAAGAAGSAHIRDDAAKASRLEHTDAFSRRIRGATGVAIALQRRADKVHDGPLILDQQQRQLRDSGARVHWRAPAAATNLRSVRARTGRRTLKVAPWVSWLLAHRISPSCSRTMP